MVSIKKLKKSWIILVVLIIVFYAGFLIYSDVESLWEFFFKINYWYIPLILLFRFGAIFFRAQRQKLFLKSLGINISEKFNLMLYIAGLAMMITPASSGSVIKSYILNKKFGCSYSKTVPIIFTEKYHDVLAPLSIIALLIIFVDIFEVRMIVLVLCFILLGIFLITRSKATLEKVILKISKFKLLTNFKENFIDFYDSSHILSNKKTMLPGWMLSVISIFIDGIAIYLGFLALGLDFGFMDSFVTVYTANILGIISFIPGGFGVVEASLLNFLLQAGFALSAASSAVLITRLSSAWFQIILGFIFKFRILKDITDV